MTAYGVALLPNSLHRNDGVWGDGFVPHVPLVAPPTPGHAGIPGMHGPTKDAAFPCLIVIGFRLNPV